MLALADDVAFEVKGVVMSWLWGIEECIVLEYVGFCVCVVNRDVVDECGCVVCLVGGGL